MDALIRAACVETSRTRLKVSSSGAAHAGARDAADAARSQLREQIEDEVRGELAARMQALLDAERERARDAGLAEARAECEARLAEDRQALARQAEQALSALSRAHDRALQAFESRLGEVCFAAVCRLVGRDAGTRSFTLDLVEQACAPLRGDVLATVRLHPRDIACLGELLQPGTLALGARSLRVVADESLALGGCVVEAESGDFDGGLEGQLRRLHAALTEAGDGPVPCGGQA